MWMKMGGRMVSVLLTVLTLVSCAGGETEESLVEQQSEETERETVCETEADLTVQREDIAALYITTESYVGSDAYVPCSVTLIPGEGDSFREVACDECEIKVRGNSTANAPKKPYNIRFPNKISLCGMDKGKRWALLANQFDKTLIRNNLAFAIGASFGCPYTSQATFVDVYVNGEYQGNYTLCEPVTDGSGRVDIDVDKGDFLLELDMNRYEGTCYITPELGQRMKVDKPETVSAEDEAYLQSFFASAEEAMKTHDIKQYEKWIDVDSFVNFYLLNELTKNIDAYDFSTRYFIKDNVLYAGPMWDYDLSLGNVSTVVFEEKYWIYNNRKKGRFGTGSGDSADGLWMNQYWFAELLQDDAFAERVWERYQELQPVIVNVYQANELGESLIDQYVERYGASFQRNNEIWDMGTVYSEYAKEENGTFEEEIALLKDWLSRRNTYLLTYLNPDEQEK